MSLFYARAALPSRLASTAFTAPRRAFSLKLLRARFASAAAPSSKPPPPPPSGPFPYPASAATAAPAAMPPPSTDPAPPPALPQTSFDERRVAVGWDAGPWSRFHNIWLRDHCRCPACFHPATKQRLIDTLEIPADVQPAHVAPTPAGLEVVWHGPAPHTSVYPWPWLREHSYDPPLAPPAPPPQEKVLWGARIQQDPPTVQYRDVMADERTVWKWLEKIDRFGFCFVAGVPPTPEDTERLTRRIAHIRETQYGRFWDFTADLAHGDTAYTTMALPAHTDTTYYTDPCGLQLFHLLAHTQGTGGATLLVDGFYAASLLATLHPAAHARLAAVPVPAHSAGSTGYLYRARAPVLRHDAASGALVGVRYNAADRGAMGDVAPGDVEPWYSALRAWEGVLRSADSEYWVQLAPGTAVVIDNQRVLHGRSAFTGQRRMCGAYVGMDDFRSRLRVLENQFGARAAAEEGTGPGSVWDPAL